MDFLKEFEKLKFGSKIPNELILYINRLPKYKIKHVFLRYDINYHFFIMKVCENGIDGFYYNNKPHIPTYSYYIIKVDDISKHLIKSKRDMDVTLKPNENYSFIFKHTRYFKIPNWSNKNLFIYNGKMEFDVFISQINRANKLLKIQHFYANENN